jgi:hypothetical protein
MEQAETESEEDATPGVMTEACSTCEPPEEDERSAKDSKRMSKKGIGKRC